jgi:hypothetical protein
VEHQDSGDSESVKTTVVVNILAGKNYMDHFMHAFGMFESFKRYAQATSLEFTLEGSEPDYHVMLGAARKALDEKGYITSAVWIASKPEVNYVDWSVKVVSSGDKWGVLEDYLKQFGISKPKEITDEP